VEQRQIPKHVAKVGIDRHPLLVHQHVVHVAFDLRTVRSVDQLECIGVQCKVTNEVLQEVHNHEQSVAQKLISRRRTCIR
jgi:hypothetical protein